MSIAGCERYRDHAAWQHADEGTRQRWQAQSTQLQTLRRSPDPLRMPGKCSLCGRHTDFVWADGATALNGCFRESLCCRLCYANSRQRAAAAVLFDQLDAASARIYLTEQASPFCLQLRRRVPGTVGSEFISSWRQRLRLSAWLLRHGQAPGLRHQDITRLSFRDGDFDAVLSMEVLEHVPDYPAALRELGRVLKPGAALVLTVPFYANSAETTTLARIDASGRIEHLQPPEYHGDPLGGGVLCYHHFGWDLLDAIRAAGFSEAEAWRLCDPAQGWPEPQWVLRARR
ncbi:methyltransferase family protein [Luteimonas cucumeris]|uniref:Methyltransferase family protein n=1 Tax=Luteimonas cucumeris TaxID=985012 RepID=A0A562LF61_9GAMM|nr:class I SAM-dependent methyltransferase [Luteimonas cucumeris]TWI06259.1 methyltransferase family protein [Luteimonas cucumeris]